MDEQDEIKQEAEEPKALAIGEPTEETVGDIMHKASGEGLKFWVIVVSVIVYLAGVTYAEIHGLTMLQKGVAPDMRFWATLGMIAAGITAVALPLALKVWTIEAKQRLFTYAFYALDFAFLAFNAFTDFDQNTGRELVGWAQTYVSYVLPASPVVIALLWAIVWELDPSVKAKVLQLSLRMAMKEKMARKVADAAKGANVSATINAAAEHEVERALTELFGTPVRGYVMNADKMPQRRTLLQSFFGYLSSLARQVFSQDMLSPSQPSASGEEANQEPPQA
jgi:hypothetical protein